MGEVLGSEESGRVVCWRDVMMLLGVSFRERFGKGFCKGFLIR